MNYKGLPSDNIGLAFMRLKSFFIFVILCVFSSEVSLAKSELSKLSSDRIKARQAVRAKMKKRQADLRSIKNKRSKKQMQRLDDYEQIMQSELEMEALRFAFYEAEASAKAGSSQDSLKKIKTCSVWSYSEI